MTRFALAALTAASIISAVATGALAQTANQSGAPLPSDPTGSNANSADDNGTNPMATPGATPNGAVRDSTQSGDNGAHARQNSGPTTGQGSNGASNGSSPAPQAPMPSAPAR